MDSEGIEGVNGEMITILMLEISKNLIISSKLC
jgi:hypothetical protein